MFQKNKLMIFSTAFVLMSSFPVLKNFYSYFSYSYLPEFKLIGLEKNGSYKDTIEGNIKADNGYKIYSIKASLDGKPFNLVKSEKIDMAKFEIPFSIDTKELNNGPHVLEIEATDSSYHKNSTKEVINFNVDNSKFSAALLEQVYKVDQGKTIHLKINSNKENIKAQVKTLSQTFDCYPVSEHSSIYECFIPIDCEQACGEYPLNAEIHDSAGNALKLSGHIIINPFEFPKQKNLVVSQSKLDEEQEVSINSKVLEEALAKWLKDSPKKKLWSGSFELPIDVKRITTPFGEIRTTPQKGRYIHKAIDVCNLPKSVVWASQNGRVIIKDRFLMSGNTVVIDHGLGVFTLYFHLDNFANVEVGDLIKKGSPVGTIGKTGFASGYHLHWELRVNNIAVDPLQWTKKTF